VTDVRGLDAVVDRAIEWARVQRPSDAMPVPDSPRLIHNDLSPEHLLLDPATGRLSGILDWSDTALGDPVRDVAPFAASHGWPFVREVMAHYPASVDEPFWHRLRFLARLCSVLWLVDAHREGADVPKHVRWVRTAFAGDERD
jgi:aminoglycoside phosphotransferase (APT) family kinase protein